MRRLFAWVAGAVGVSAAYRALRRTPAAAPAPDPAEELRAKISAAKAAEGSEPEGSDPAVLDVDARRRAVHDEARASIDELRDS